MIKNEAAHDGPLVVLEKRFLKGISRHNFATEDVIFPAAAFTLLLGFGF